MKYSVISADCHIDLPWLPPDLFVSEATLQFRHRMPYVDRTEQGEFWTTKNGARFGLRNGMGSAGRRYVPGEIHRSDRMAEQGLYRDGAKGIPRLIDPELRVKDQDLDGVQAEVIYGVLGAAMRLNDDEASAELIRIYNSWLADFCTSKPERFAGIASIPSYSTAAAVHEVKAVAKRGVLRGVEIACTHDMDPLFHSRWEPLWAVIEETNLPLHFHTIGPRIPYDYETLSKLGRRQAFAVHITSFQMSMSKYIMEVIFGGILEAHPRLQIVVGESGIGWLPYMLDHMDLEWEDQFADLTLTKKPSEYWHEQCYATYQSDHIGLRLIDVIGVENVMWGSDFPHPDGVWPDSLKFIDKEFEDIPDDVRRRITCDNAASLYGFDGFRN